MFKIKSSTKLTSLIIVFPLLTLLMYGSLSHLFFFYTKQNDIKSELIRYEKTLMDEQKNSLIEKVENLTRFIRYYNYKNSDKIKKDVKKIIYLTSDIINNLYNKYKNTMSSKELKLLIINALNNINFKDNVGYIFLMDMEGNSIVHPNKEIENTNILNIRDINGKLIIKEFMGVVREHKEGFVDYYWYLNSKNKKTMYYKITFVKTLDMYNWYIGAGKYLKYITKFAKKEMLSYIKENSRFKYGYFFISNSKNEIIYHPNKGKKELIHKFRMEDVYEDDKQIAFTSYIPEYDWYITAVKELHDIRKSINKQKELNKKILNKNVKTNMYLIIIMWFISIVLSIYLSFIVNKMLKKYENQLDESNKKLIFQSRQALIGELFSMIAHQWRQPINKIASIILLLRFNLSNKKFIQTKFDEKLQNIENNIEFMSETIDDFRTFYQPKNNKENTDIAFIINKAIDFIDFSIDKKNINIIKNMEKITYKMYSNEFLQIMINLIKNAHDAIDTNGIINIDLFEKENIIYIIIKDDGIGINSENISKVFDPYFTTKNDSMGLGLYMSKMIIQRHLIGDIKVEALPKGTQFTINLYRQS